MKSWKHLTFEQRKVISNGISHKYKLKEIAEAEKLYLTEYLISIN